MNANYLNLRSSVELCAVEVSESKGSFENFYRNKFLASDHCINLHLFPYLRKANSCILKVKTEVM